MSTNVPIPPLGDSVSEAVLLKWHKQDGEAVKQDEPLCELETDKANVDLPSPAAGILKRLATEGQTVRVGQNIGTLDANGTAMAVAAPAKAQASKAAAPVVAAPVAAAPVAATPVAATPLAATPLAATPASAPAAAKKSSTEDLSPAVRRLIEEKQLDPEKIIPTGPGGRLTKEDVQKYLEAKSAVDNAADVSAAAAATSLVADSAKHETPVDGIRRVPMSKIRKKIAERLVQAQQTAAILTTFNEVDLQNVIDLRTKYKEKFEKTHGVGLGFMSFFARAVILALKQYPLVNASIDGSDIIHHDYVNLGIAVSTERGLAVPVLRNAEKMSFAKIENEIKRLATATRDGKLSLEELSGGTFTVTNGGVFGSLLSTPILNPPQSGILGMHSIQKRPVAVNDQVVIRPMMYIALSYDHRIVDGRDSVTFLVRVKELLEDPARLMLEV
jgi:2-oxoglutarate dehydrogenase E2 component (dihydrolipoamide succinyltransferase)